MKSAPSLGPFEQVVLTAILRCGTRAYGVKIHESAESLSGSRPVAIGAVYATLERMEDKGLIRSWLSDPTPERGGRSRRYYKLEQDGEQALRDSLAATRRLSEAVEQIWGKLSCTTG